MVNSESEEEEYYSSSSEAVQEQKVAVKSVKRKRDVLRVHGFGGKKDAPTTEKPRLEEAVTWVFSDINARTKFVKVHGGLTTKQFIVTDTFKFPKGARIISIYKANLNGDTIEVEIGGGVQDFANAFAVCPSFTKMFVELEAGVESDEEEDVKKVHKKRAKVVAFARLKHVLGLVDEEGNSRQGFPAKWTDAACTIMREDPRWVEQFKALRAGMARVFGEELIALNPAMAICPGCGKTRQFGKMSQPRELLNHLKLENESASSLNYPVAVKRLEAWMANKHITRDALADLGELQDVFVDDDHEAIFRP
jgi:hypothetical protein